jgi:glycosyltransferase involved in cell wall biosynthesis
LRASVALQDNSRLEAFAEEFQVFVFHRTLATEKMKRFFTLLKQKKKTVLFEADDLIYDPAYLHLMDYYKNINTLEKKFYAQGVGGEFLADPYITHATTTTTYLKQKLEERGKMVFIVRNKMSEEDVRWAEEIRQSPSRRDDGLIRISYLSGTPSHNRDFATIKSPLIRILQEFPHVRLVLAGPLDTDDELNKFEAQIIRVPFAPRREYFTTVASADINVAPLEVGNAFCESKSELKFFEAGLLGVPTVAAATQTFREAITEGVDGMVASSEEEWYEKLKRLLTDEALRKTIATRARETALQKYTTRNGSSPQYYEFLRQHIHT